MSEKNSFDFHIRAFVDYVNDNHIHVTEENIDDLMKEFKRIKNQKDKHQKELFDTMSDEEKIATLMEWALEADTNRKAYNQVKKILQIDPHHIKGNVMAIVLKHDGVDAIPLLLELKRRYHKQLKSEEMKDSYFALMSQLSEEYQNARMYSKAIETLEEIVETLRILPLPMCYDLICLNIHLERFEEANFWMATYLENDPLNHLFEAMILYQHGYFDDAKNQINILCDLCPSIKQLTNQPEKCNTFECVDLVNYIRVVGEHPYLFDNSRMFYWIENIIRSYKKTRVKETILLN